MDTLKNCFMHDPQIPNMYLANLESDHFDDFEEPLGPRGCVKSKIFKDQMLMFDGNLQVLFYAPPPNSQLLYSKPKNSPLFDDFDSSCCVTSKS